MSTTLKRRDFLKLSGFALSALALQDIPQPDGQTISSRIGRVTTHKISVRAGPSFQSDRRGWIGRDQLVPLLESFHAPAGPQHNSIWYRVEGGYIHSGYIQEVEYRFFTPPATIPESGQLCTLSVPYTQAYRYTKKHGWQPLYRLYYQSNHWATGLDLGPDDRPWIRITDERLRVHYYVPARHVRFVPDEALTPLSPEVPPEEKRILVSLGDQTLAAYEGLHQVFKTQISTGIQSNRPSPNGIPTATPAGHFRINRKMPVRHMGDGYLTPDPEAYELPGVPWVSTFVSTGVAFHGTYWHNHYGIPMSHGCVNMRYQDAQWLYRWANPPIPPGSWATVERGTLVIVS